MYSILLNTKILNYKCLFLAYVTYGPSMPITAIPPSPTAKSQVVSVPSEQLKVGDREILVDADLGSASDRPEAFPKLELKDDLGQVTISI